MRYSRLIALLLGIIVIALLGYIMQEMKSVLLPFVIAVFFSIIFQPIMTFLRAKKVPTAVSLLVVMITLGLVLILLAMIFFSSAEAFVEAQPRYEAKAQALTADAIVLLEGVAAQLGVSLQETNAADFVNVSTVTRLLSSWAGNFVSFLGNAFLVVLFMLFILAGSGQLTSKVRQAFEHDSAQRIARIVANITQQVRQYLITKTLVSFGTGFLTFLVLWIFGVDFALLWGFLAFLLNFIPNVGSLVAVAFPVVLSTLQFDTLVIPIVVLIILMVIQLIFGNVVEPRMMAFSLNLSPLLVLVSLIFWGYLWGLWGMVLSVPFTAMLKIMFENIRPLHPISVLMSGNVTPATAIGTPASAYASEAAASVEASPDPATSDVGRA